MLWFLAHIIPVPLGAAQCTGRFRSCGEGEAHRGSCLPCLTNMMEVTGPHFCVRLLGEQSQELSNRTSQYLVLCSLFLFLFSGITQPV